MEKKKITITQVKNFCLVLLGTFILAFGTEIFISQSNLIMGGMSGIALILQGTIPGVDFELVITILTWLFFIISWIFLGWDFTVKTLISTISYPIFIYACSYLIDPELNLFNGFFIIKSNYQELLSCIFGGAFVGAGCALAMMGGGSTGGVDIISLIICKYNKKIVEARMIFIIDAIIDVIGMFVLNDLALSLLGITSAFISATIIDKLFLGPNVSFKAEVITTHPEEITKEIISQIERTTTSFKCIGGYTNKEKTMIMISFTAKDFEKVKNIINKCDPQAFVLIHKAYEVSGEGWTYNESNLLKGEQNEGNNN